MSKKAARIQKAIRLDNILAVPLGANGDETETTYTAEDIEEARGLVREILATDNIFPAVVE